MTWREAKILAEAIKRAIEPHCERVELAGSIRRERPVCNDLEIIAVAKWEEFTLPGTLIPDNHSRLYGWATAHQGEHGAHAIFDRPIVSDEILCDPESFKPGDEIPSLLESASAIHWIKPSEKEIVYWRVEESGKLYKGFIAEAGIKLDLFITTPECWGCIYTIRTGSKEFSHALIKYAPTIGLRFDKGRLWRDDEPLPTTEEGDVFKHLRLEYVEPRFRTDERAIALLRGAIDESASYQ